MTTRTRQLTRELANERVTVLLEKKKSSPARKILSVLVLFALGIGSFLYFFDESERAHWLPSGKSAPVIVVSASEEKWRAELDGLQVKYQVELASRKELEQQIVTLNEQIKEMQTELDFFRSNNGQNPANAAAAAKR